MGSYAIGFLSYEMYLITMATERHNIDVHYESGRDLFAPHSYEIYMLNHCCPVNFAMLSITLALSG